MGVNFPKSSRFREVATTMFRKKNASA